MSKPQRRDRSAGPPAEPRLSGIRKISVDDDERPSREDKTYDETIFTRPVVPLPRFLTGRKKPRRS
jgi:hypothetical protein